MTECGEAGRRSRRRRKQAIIQAGIGLIGVLNTIGMFVCSENPATLEEVVAHGASYRDDTSRDALTSPVIPHPWLLLHNSDTHLWGTFPNIFSVERER